MSYKPVQQIRKKFHLERFYNIDKIQFYEATRFGCFVKKYLWVQLKDKNHKSSPISISIFALNDDRYKIKLEIDDKECKSYNNDNVRSLMNKYYRYLSIPIEQNSGLLFEKGDNIFNKPQIEVLELSKTSLSAKERIGLVYYINRNNCCEENFQKGISLILKHSLLSHAF